MFVPTCAKLELRQTNIEKFDSICVVWAENLDHTMPTTVTST